MKQYKAYISLFFFSALVMFIEIIGAKMLTPILGGSQSVWISQILVTLLSLAIGGAISSKIKNKKIEKISLNIYLSCLYLMLILCFFHDILPFFESLDFTWASFTLSLTLYTYPLISLGMIFPSLYIILEKEFKQNLGSVYFVGTIGSAMGTIATYFAVYFTSNLNLLLISSVIGIIICIFLNYKSKKNSSMINIAPLIPLVILIFFSSKKTIQNYETIYFSNSHFGEVAAIKNNEEEIVISSDGVIQNGFNKKKQSIHLFSYALERLPFFYRKDIKSTLMIGFGVGAGVNFLRKKNQAISAVEINPSMIDLANKIFPDNLTNIKLSIMDGRVFLKKTEEMYDSILLDCFLVDFVPKYLVSKESFSLIKNRLNKGGVLTINSFGIVSPEADFLTVSIYKTLTTEFKFVKVFSNNNWNVFFVASEQPLVEGFGGPLDLSDIPISLSKELSKLSSPIATTWDLKNYLVLEDKSSKIEILDNTPRDLYRKKHRKEEI